MADVPRLVDYLSSVPDPRVNRTRRHDLVDILFIALLAVLCGAESFVEMEEFGKAKQAWLTERLGLINGIPSHDTFARVFARVDPDALRRCLSRSLETLKERVPGEVVALDGKTLRHSFDTATGQNALHVVSAWANESCLVLGEVKVDAKTNEIKAIPALLEMLDIEGCTITIDAMGCQTEIAQRIRKQGADYVLALKGNQGLLHEDVKLFLEDARQTAFKDTPHSFHETTDYGHGRSEIRRCYCVSNIDWLIERHPGRWDGLASIVLVESERTIGSNTSTETRFYISSLPPGDAERMLSITRSHWGIENSLHWVLDVVFNEDGCRVRKDNAPENFAILRHLALNVLRQDTRAKHGLKARRLRAGWDNDYLQSLLTI